MTWMLENWSEISPLLTEHVVLAVLPTIIGFVIAVPLGLVLHGFPRVRAVAIGVATVVFTIPSIALFVLIPTTIGTRFLDPANVVIALSVYSVSLTLRAIAEALDGVPASTREAARALGTSDLRLRLTVDLPLSIPMLTASVRVVAVTNVAMVSIGAVIGVGGLGRLFTDGYQRAFPTEIVVGIVLILAIAVVIDRALATTSAALTPWQPTAGRAARLQGRSRAAERSAS